MFHRKRQGAIDVITGAEPLVGDNLEQAGETLSECLGDGHPRAVFDLQEVALISGAGLELLLDMREMFEERAGALKLAGPNPLCQDILDVTGLSDRFEIYPEVRLAVGSFLQ